MSRLLYLSNFLLAGFLIIGGILMPQSLLMWFGNVSNPAMIGFDSLIALVTLGLYFMPVVTNRRAKRLLGLLSAVCLVLLFGGGLKYFDTILLLVSAISLFVAAIEHPVVANEHLKPVRSIFATALLVAGSESLTPVRSGRKLADAKS